MKTEIRRKMWDIVEEVYRAWKVSPTPETVGTDVSGILGVCHSFLGRGRGRWAPDHSYRGAGLVRDRSESAHNVFVVSIAGAVGLF